METPLQIRHVVESEIRMAFRAVTLDQGTSLRRAHFADNFEFWNGNSASPTHGEITDDWSQVSLEELERENRGIVHLDALGFRYYIPALMLSVLSHYESPSMRVISTLSGLYPKKDGSWEHRMHRYSLLNAAQKTAIARFLAALPDIVELGYEDQKIIPRALRNYWGQYLQRTAE